MAGEAVRRMYAIWNLGTGNREGWYRTEAEALADVRDALARFGRSEVAAWALARHEGGATEAIAEGDRLIERARAAEAPA